MSFDDWTLEDAHIRLIDGDRGKNYPKQADFCEQGHCLFLSAKNVTLSGFQFAEQIFIGEERHKLLRAGKLERNDIVLTTRGTIGNVAIYDNSVEYPVVRINSGMIIIRPAPEIWNPRFLYYVLTSDLIKNQITSLTSGSAVPQLPARDLKKFLLPKVPLAVQSQIESIISSLADKIQLNGQINQTLEQMAQAIFKSWFVDFEPVKAKIAARERWHALQPGNESASPVCYAGELEGQSFDVDLETYMNLAAMQAISGKDADQLAQMQTEQPNQYSELWATAEIFPSAMQDSELGEIPNGWIVSQIGDEVTVVGGGTPSTKTPEFWEGGQIHWTTPKDLSNLTDKVLIDTERKIAPAGLAKISSGLLPVDTVLMSSRAPVGYLALAKTAVAVNQGYIAMKCEQRLTPEFVIQWCTANMGEIKGRASGTTFAEINKKNFRAIRLVVPCVEAINTYSRYVGPLYSQVEAKVRESLTLSGLRDTLLPKLLSGELILPDTEEALHELRDLVYV